MQTDKKQWSLKENKNIYMYIYAEVFKINKHILMSFYKVKF